MKNNKTGKKRLNKVERMEHSQARWDALTPHEKYLELCKYFGIKPGEKQVKE